MFLDNDDEEPAATIALGRVIATAFVIQGTHFTILRQIHPSDVCDLHLASLDFLSRKLANYVKQTKMTGRKSATTQAHGQAKMDQTLTLFKVLVNLLGPIGGREALRIRQKMDDTWRTSGVKPGNGKGWDGWRSYEKRVTNIAMKDPTIKKNTISERRDVDEDGDENNEVATEAGTEAAGDQDEGGNGAEEVDEDFETGGPMMSTPQKRSRTARDEPREDEVEDADEEAEEAEVEEGGVELFGDVDLNLDENVELDIDTEFDKVDKAQSKGKGQGGVAVEPVAKKRKTRA